MSVQSRREELPYLPVYNACPYITNTPIFFRLHSRKKKEAETFPKLALKIMFWIHFKKVDAIIFSENSLNAQAIHGTISSSACRWLSWLSIGLS